MQWQGSPSLDGDEELIMKVCALERAGQKRSYYIFIPIDVARRLDWRRGDLCEAEAKPEEDSILFRRVYKAKLSRTTGTARTW